MTYALRGRARRAGARGFAALAFVALAGCASVAPEPPPAGDTLSGRLAVRVEATAQAPAQSVSGSFELQGTPRAGRLSLVSPLGTLVAQARWTEQRATLVTPSGETPFENLDALTREMLGESLPVAALFDWLRGRPWPAAPSQAQPQGFEQLGWRVDLARFADGLVTAERAQPPAVSVRARLDAP